MTPISNPNTAGRGSRFQTQAIASAIQRVFSVLYGIVLMALGVPYFGLTVLGVWLVIQSIVAYASTAGVGMPAAVLGALSRSSDPAQNAATVRVALRLTAALGTTLAAASVAALVVSDRLVSAIGSQPSVPSVRATAAIMVGGSLLLLPSGTLVAALGGLGRVVVQQAVEALRVAVRLSAVLWTVWSGGTIVDLAIGTMAGELVVAAVSAALVLRRHMAVPVLFKGTSPAPAGFVRSSLRFFGLQIEHSVIQQTDLLVARAVVGLGAVTALAAPHRAYQAVLTVVLGALGAPSWPLLGAAYEAGDLPELHRIHQRNVRIVLFIMSWGWVVGGVLMPAVLAVWVGESFPVDASLNFIIGGYALFYAFTAQQALLLNVMDKTRPQLRIFGAEAGVNLFTSLLLGSFVGLPGVMAGSVVGVATTSGWMMARLVREETDGDVGSGGRTLLWTLSYSIPAAAVAQFYVARGGTLAAVFTCCIFGVASLVHLAPSILKDLKGVR